MKIPEITKQDLIDWLKSKQLDEIVGTTNCIHSCLLFNYLDEQGTPVVEVNPSYAHFYRAGTIHYKDEQEITRYRRMTEFEDEVGRAFDAIGPYKRGEIYIDANGALAMECLS